MGEDEKTQDNPQGMPLPPLPPGISLPLPPPPPPPVEEVNLDEDLEILENIEETQIEEVEYSQSTDFQSHWEKRKASDPNLSVGNRESMYGHIDRIATGEVGTLLDRFSNRFGSELDREIIVLRKKQQQEMREIKPTVELIQAPTEEYEEELEEELEEISSDEDFAEFFSVINNLLGDITDEDVIKNFIASDSFSLFEEVGASPGSVSEEQKGDFFRLINQVLGDLPDDNESVEAFIGSSDFSIFVKMGELYGE
ncbi:MAG: hypothetical protein CBE40_03355 [Euryarchaeota archaeon TMED280]|nr:hypothetical protein [Euryarchaeota archaeon]OUX45946.1 MAG: hypothetical protein CBE40_03355 [Euryarchaeota archaeon TMED280]|tara:strand:- start:355 stop:1116 length:762 start_codon:yes stop_codon:yes gene_type:complete